MKPKTMLLIPALLALFAGEASGAGGSVEVMGGQANTTLDVKLSGEVAPRTGIFVRNRTTVDYNNQVSPFTLADLTFNIAGGLDAVAEVQMAPGMGAVPRLGVQYFKAFGDFSVYGLATGKARENPNAEMIVLLRYMPRLSERIKGFAQVEALSDIGRTGHEYSTQRIRLGLDISGYRLGAAADLVETGNKAAMSYNMGGFVSKNF